MPAGIFCNYNCVCINWTLITGLSDFNILNCMLTLAMLTLAVGNIDTTEILEQFNIQYVALFNQQFFGPLYPYLFSFSGLPKLLSQYF